MKRKIPLSFAVGLLCLLTGSLGARADSAAGKGRAEAREAVRELRDFRSSMEEEFRRLNGEIENLRREAATLRSDAGELERENASLRTAIQARRQERSRLTRRRTEIVAELDRLFREWEAATPAPWHADVEAILDPWFAGTAVEEKPVADVPMILREAVQHIRSRQTSRRFEGAAVLPDGSRREGTFFSLGPLAVWSGREEGEAGLIDLRDNRTPRVVSVSRGRAEKIENLIASGEGSMPADLRGGDATRAHTQQSNLLGEVQAGGIWIYPILAGGLLVILVSAAKILQFSRLRMPSQALLDRFLEAYGSSDEGETGRIVEECPEPGRLILKDLLGKRNLSPALLEEYLHARILAVKPRLERGLPFLAITAATAPLLGLLGTVTGMIGTFQQITLFGAGDPSTFAGGISEALITTEFGLVVAVPAVILHGWFSRRSTGMLTQLERIVSAAIPLAHRNHEALPDSTDSR